MSCLACSLPRLVGLLGLFNSPYPSRTPKLSQWSDRPRRVGLGPQFLSRGSLTVRDSVVGLTDCSGGHCWGCRSVMSCLVCSLPRLVGLLGLFNSPYPSRTPKLSQWSDRPRRVGVGPQFLSRGSLTARDSVVIGRRWGFMHVVCLLGRHSAHRLQGRPLHATYPHHGRSILATAASCSVAPNGILPATSNTLC